MKVTGSERKAGFVATVEGSVDAETADDLTAAMISFMEEGHHRFVLDFALVDYISSAGLRSLLGLLKKLRQKDGELTLASVQEDVRRVLELSGFARIMQIFPDLDAALEYLGN